VKELPKLIEVLLGLGVDRICISPYVRPSLNGSEELFANMNDFKWLFHKIEESWGIRADKVEDGYIVINSGKKTHAIVYNTIASMFKKLRAKPYTCGAYKRILAIFPDGRVVGCGRMTALSDKSLDELTVGNIRAESIKKVWDKSKTLRLAFPSKETFMGTPCFYCDKLEKCMPESCYVYSRVFFKRLLAPKIFCKPAIEKTLNIRII